MARRNEDRVAAGLRGPSADDSLRLDTAHTGVPIPDTLSVNLARAVLGTVPVEEDGSAYFVVPARREVFFQALDEKGLAVTSMRSGTQFQPGERGHCQGCHEPRGRTPVADVGPRWPCNEPPSRLRPDVDGTNPFSYPRLVQPVLDKHCVACHQRRPARRAVPRPEPGGVRGLAAGHLLRIVPESRAEVRILHLRCRTARNDPKFYRTTPGEFGARASKLYPTAAEGALRRETQPAEMHRLTRMAGLLLVVLRRLRKGRPGGATAGRNRPSLAGVIPRALCFVLRMDTETGACLSLRERTRSFAERKATNRKIRNLWDLTVFRADDEVAPVDQTQVVDLDPLRQSARSLCGWRCRVSAATVSHLRACHRPIWRV